MSRNKAVKKTHILLGGACVILIVLILSIPLAENMGHKDFIIYWSAARQLATGQNPYDRAALTLLQCETLPMLVNCQDQALPTWTLMSSSL